MLRISEELKAKKDQFLEDNISEVIRNRAKQPEPISYEEYCKMRMNSYERRYLLPKYDQNCLVEIIDHCLNQCAVKTWPHKPATTYEEAILGEYLPELLGRLNDTHEH